MSCSKSSQAPLKIKVTKKCFQVIFLSIFISIFMFQAVQGHEEYSARDSQPPLKKSDKALSPAKDLKNSKTLKKRTAGLLGVGAGVGVGVGAGVGLGFGASLGFGLFGGGSACCSDFRNSRSSRLDDIELQALRSSQMQDSLSRSSNRAINDINFDLQQRGPPTSSVIFPDMNGVSGSIGSSSTTISRRIRSSSSSSGFRDSFF